MYIVQRQIFKVVDNWSIISTTLATLGKNKQGISQALVVEKTWDGRRGMGWEWDVPSQEPSFEDDEEEEEESKTKTFDHYNITSARKRMLATNFQKAESKECLGLKVLIKTVFFGPLPLGIKEISALQDSPCVAPLQDPKPD